jgi:hypothetical protein
VPYLNWSTKPRLTLAICQLTILSAVGTFLLLPFIPWRLVMFLAGESALVIGHPAIQDVLDKHFEQTDLEAYEASFSKSLRFDALPDLALEPGVVLQDVAVWEEEGINADGTVAYHRFLPALAVEYEGEVKPAERNPPDGWKWLEDDWFIDRTWTVGPFDKGSSPFRLERA